jgi:hypothetical protein
VAVGLGESKRVGHTGKSLTFGSSPNLQEERKFGFKSFHNVLRIRVAVYAVGRDISQPQNAEEVKRRLIRTVAVLI